MVNSIKLKGRIALLLCPTVMLCCAVECGCQGADLQEIIIANKTSEKIYCLRLRLGSDLKNSYTKYFSDSNGYRYQIHDDVAIIDPNASANNSGFRNVLCIDMPTASDRHPVMGFILLKQETFSRYDVRYIVNNDIYDVRYILSYDELKKNGFKIYYNGECSEETVTTLTH